MRKIKYSTLYKKTSSGAIQSWSIRTENNVIVTRWGQVGGAIQETKDVIKTGKNQGKANETTPEQQAQAETHALWLKKLKSGYVKTVEEAQQSKTDSIVQGSVSPMLAHKFSEHAQKIQYPCFVQPKLDGHRCVAVVSGGSVTLWSRTRKRIAGLPHIEKALSTLSDVVLDGELYVHGVAFEELTGFIRSVEPKEGFEVVEYHVYDIVNDLPQRDRTEQLQKLALSKPLALVETRLVDSKDALDEAFSEFLESGYEGLMVRNADSPYVNKRSYDLQKVKTFDDAEFEVIGVQEGRGKLAGKAIFVLKHGETTFKAKMKGSVDDLAKYVQNTELAIGRKLTVRYFGMSTTNGVPRFPVGIRFRDE